MNLQTLLNLLSLIGLNKNKLSEITTFIIKNPQILQGGITQIISQVQETLRDTKLSFDVEFREEKGEKILFIILQIQNSNERVETIVTRLRHLFLEIEDNTKILFNKVRFIVETKEKKRYYITANNP